MQWLIDMGPEDSDSGYRVWDQDIMIQATGMGPGDYDPGYWVWDQEIVIHATRYGSRKSVID